MAQTKEETHIKQLCVHTLTTKTLTLEQCLEFYGQTGIRGITVWQQTVEGKDLARAAKSIKNSGLELISYCRGGFFPAVRKEDREQAIQKNRKLLEEASILGAPMLVLVCGAEVGQSLEKSRQQILEGIESILPRAEKLGIKLAVEPLHPMYADNRSAINTLKQANDLCERIRSDFLGVAIDVYHLWWDPDLEKEIARCGQMGKIFAFHICDWKTPTTDILNDRGLMGEGCIPVRQIRNWVRTAGFAGYDEVEIFSNHWWRQDPLDYLTQIKNAYHKHCI